MQVPAATAPTLLLRSKAVQRELGLSPVQWSRISKLVPAAENPDPATINAAYAEVRRVLNPRQSTRLEEIHRQALGLRSLTYPPYGDAVGVSPTQLSQLNAANSRLLSQAIGNPVRPSSAGGAPVQIRVDTKRIEAQLEVEAQRILTPAQWRKWKSMLGKPFAANAR